MLRAITWLGMVALLVSLGCSESKSPSTVASKPESDQAGKAETTMKDSAVQPAAATVDTAESKGKEVVAVTATEAVSPEKKVEKPAKEGVAVGDQAPAWKELEGTDGKKHSLRELAEAKAIAVIFTCNTCPVARAYEERITELTNKYKDKSVVVVAINVNKDSANSLPAMKERAEKEGFPFAYMFDPSQEIARAYGATVTPHAFLLDGKRNVAYMGAIDDSQNLEKVSKHSLQDAIDNVLAGEAVAVPTTKQFGCGIRYE
ncbi:MAG: thioredoxin family protein [Pirellulales bacterium]|nr:thioredoxin family protein [Pirellulales bacterium]